MARSTSPSVSVVLGTPPGAEAEGTVIWVRGDHDVATKASVAIGIMRAAQHDEQRLVVDLSGVTFMDASTVGAILGSRNRLRAGGRSLEVRAPSPRARRVLEVCGLVGLVQRAPAGSPTAAAALASWVDVPPTSASGAIDGGRAGAAQPNRAAGPARALVAADGGAAARGGTEAAAGGGP